MLQVQFEFLLPPFYIFPIYNLLCLSSPNLAGNLRCSIQLHYLHLSSQEWRVFSVMVSYLYLCQLGKHGTAVSLMLIPLESLQIHSHLVMVFC